MARTQNERAVIDLVINGQQAQTSLKDVSLAVTNARSALNKMKATDAGYKDKLKELQALMAAQRQMNAEINQTTTAWGRWKANAASTAAGMVGGNLIGTAISAAASAIPAAIAKYREFDAASKELSAVTGATGADLDYLNKTASQTGPSFGKSGAEMLEAYKLMASAKPELLAQKELLVETTKAAITLSQAGKIDLASATQVTAESLNQFGESADQANRFINVIAAGAKEGSAEISDMGTALKNSGTVASSQNVSFEQTNAILQSMSTIALKGGEAGTQLRNVLLTLGSGADETNPRVVGLDKALDNLGKKNMSTAEMTKLFGKENLIAAQHIITHRGEISELTQKLTGTQEAFSQAEKNNASLDHQLEVFWARVSALAVLLGTKLVPIFTKVVEVGLSLTQLLTGSLTPASEAATQQFEAQRTTVQNLTKNFAPLLDRHDELKKKTVLTKDEQAELKKIVAQVASTVPSAVSEFDKYGNALAVNTDKARDFVAMQKELLKYQNKKAIDETDDELSDKQQQLKTSVDRRRSGKVLEQDPTKMGGYRYRDMSEDELRGLDAKNRQLQADVAALELRKRGLNGDYLETPAATPTPPKTSSSGGGKTGEGTESKEEKAARLKRERAVKAEKKHEESLEQLMAQARARTAQADDDEFLRDQLAFGEHYKKMFEMVQGNKEKIEAITKLMYDELDSIVDKHEKKKEEAAQKQLEHDNKTAFHAAMKSAQQGGEEAQGAIDAKETLYDEDTGTRAYGESDINMQRLQADQVYLTQKLLLEQTFAQESADTQRQLTENWNAQVKLRAETERAYAEQMKQAEWSLQDAKRNAMSEGVGVLKGFLKEGTVAYKGAIIAQKAFAIAQVIVDMNREIAQIYANPAWSLLPDGGLTLKTASATAAKVRAGISIATIAATGIGELAAKKDGGYTGIQELYGSPSGFTSGPTLFNQGRRSYIAGEAGREFVISNKALQNPVVANFARLMDSAQKTGNYSQLMSGASGGSMMGSPSAPSTPAPAGGMSQELGMAILNQLQKSHSAMEDYASRPILNNYRLFEQYQDQVQQIRNDTKLTAD